MKTPRPRFQKVRDPKKLRALAAPLALQVLDALQAVEEATAADLSDRVGRPREVIYYHLKRLVAAGFVRESGRRPTTRRPVSVYRAVADEIRVDITGPSAGWSEGLAGITRTGLRALERDAVAALRNGELPSYTPATRLAFFSRRVMLDDAGLRALNAALRRIVNETLRRRPGVRGDVYSIGFALAPAAHRSRKASGSPRTRRRSGDRSK